MNPYAMFKTNVAAEADQGIALDYGSFSIRINRAGGSNKRYGQELIRRLKPYRRQIDNDTLDNAVAEKVMAGLYADTVVIGWDGVTDENNAPPPLFPGELHQALHRFAGTVPRCPGAGGQGGELPAGRAGR